MENKTVSILSTRPLDADTLQNLPDNFQIDIVSFIETKNIVDAFIEQEIITTAEQKQTIVFTSMNAAEAVVAILQKNKLQPDWKIFCLGNSTKAILLNIFNESNIQSRGKNALDLANSIIEQSIQLVVFFCGNIRRDELPETLAAKGVEVKEVVVYETIETKKSIDKTYNGILFFSPSAVRSFFSNNRVATNTVLFAIGNTTAAEIKNFSANTIQTANESAKELLLNQAIHYFQSYNHTSVNQK
ncbi:MAG: hypothetical protein C0459_14045 [Chitinophaga sp.]|jgi:uroporphyrinogen-III synthase|nr:hypothetical protein [Chitinophaga sp.]